MIRNYELHSIEDISPFHEIHQSSKGMIELCHLQKNSIPTKWHGIHRRYGTLVRHYIEQLAADHNNESIYYSMNTFKSYKRNKENLLELKALYLDVDCYTKGYTQEQTIAYVEDLVKQNKIPSPTFTVDSGRGLYLIWKIHMAPPQALPRWKKLMDYFYEQLKEYGADPKCLEPARILRLNGTVHEETKKVVRTISYVPITYNLYNLRNDYLQPLQRLNNPISIANPKNKINTNKSKYRFTKSNNVLYLQNQYKTYQARIQDLYKLAELREYSLKKYHCREMMCFLLRYWLYCTTKNDTLALEKTLAFNMSLKEPLEEAEVIKATTVNEKAKKLQAYRYGNKKLIEILSITEEEQYQLTTIHSNEIRLKKINHMKKEQRRNEEGLTPREQRKKDIEDQVKTLTKSNYTTKQIAEKTGVSVRQIQRVKKALDLI